MKIRISIFFKITAVVFIVFLFSKCVTTTKTTVKNNLSSIYNPSSHALHPLFRVFNETEQETKIYLKLFTNELLFSKANKEGTEKTLITVDYVAKPTFRSEVLLDSGSFSFTLRKSAKQTSMVTFLKISKVQEKKYVVEINVTDKNSGKKSKTFVEVDRNDSNPLQNYIPFQFNNNKPLFQNWIHKNDTLLIKQNKVDANTLFVKYYKTDFSIPLPPFTSLSTFSNDIKPDSVWTLPYKEGAIFSSKIPGIYILRNDSNAKLGLVQTNFSENFPELKTSAQLLESLQYLLSSEEYLNIKKSDTKKLEIDNFWLKTVNNTDKARENLKIWYGRATYSNYYFTSYIEGWKTDRGMIYMVFGPPPIVNQTDGAERWRYNDSRTGKNVDFIFIKKENSISENDYILQREYDYRTIWYNSIDSWRSGIVYSIP